MDRHVDLAALDLRLAFQRTAFDVVSDFADGKGSLFAAGRCKHEAHPCGRAFVKARATETHPLRSAIRSLQSLRCDDGSRKGETGSRSRRHQARTRMRGALPLQF